jgi:hypothetical protein
MPLPFAPPPKDSSLYQQLESTTLQTLTSDQLDTIRAKTFSQGTEGNEDEYRRLLLLGLAADQLSLSGPLPATGKITKTNFTAASQNAIVASANPGEVWQIMGACANRVAASGTFTFVLSFTDGVDSVRIESLTGSGYNEFNITSTAGPMYIDQNISLEVDSSGGSFPTDVDILVALQRVR